MRSRTKQFLFLVSGGALGAVLVQGAIVLFQEPSRDIGAIMAAASDSMNRHLPMMIDSGTQLIATMGSGRDLQYNYRLVYVDASTLDTSALIAAFTPRLRTQACSAPELRDTFLKRGVTVSFAYADSTYRRLFRIDVAPADCGF